VRPRDPSSHVNGLRGVERRFSFLKFVFSRTRSHATPGGLPNRAFAYHRISDAFTENELDEKNYSLVSATA